MCPSFRGEAKVLMMRRVGRRLVMSFRGVQPIIVIVFVILYVLSFFITLIQFCLYQQNPLNKLAI